MKGEISTTIQDAMFVATHPALCFRAKGRQTAVEIEHSTPPGNISIEDYPTLSLADAARVLQKAEKRLSGGVPMSAWSQSDQERMDRGERPVGHPEHTNV